MPPDLPGAEPVTASGRAGVAAFGAACATAMAVGSVMEWASLDASISIEGTQRRGDVTLVLAVAAAASLILWGARMLDTRLLPALATLSFAVGLYVVIDDARDLVELSRQTRDLARQLDPSIGPDRVLKLGIGVFVAGAAAFAGLTVALWALVFPE